MRSYGPVGEWQPDGIATAVQPRFESEAGPPARIGGGCGPWHSGAMATKTTYIVQAFGRKRGQLVPGAKDVAPTANGALKRAEALSGRAPGTAALAVEADDETGEVSKVDILGTFGEVPDDFADSLRG